MIEDRKFVDVLIIGAGPAGLYASYNCNLSAIDYMLVEALPEPGGQLMALYPEKEIYGVPGFDSSKAKDFVYQLSGQCLKNKGNVLFSRKVSNITKLENDCFEVKILDIDLNKSFKINAKFIIVSSGIGDMKPNVPSNICGLDSIKSDFVQYCKIRLDLYKDKDIIVAGGGDSAIDFVINTAHIAKSIKLIHRRSKFTCEPKKLDTIEKLKESVGLEVLTDHIIQEVFDHREVRATNKDGHEVMFNPDYLVFFYGFSACESSLFGLPCIGLETENSLIKVDFRTMETSIKNCYAAGDVVSYDNKKKNIVPCFFEADRAVRSIKAKLNAI